MSPSTPPPARSRPPLAAGALVLLALLVSPCATRAQPARQGTDAGCDARRETCTAECRAQYFAVDPKRAGCVADCAAQASRCTAARRP